MMNGSSSSSSSSSSNRCSSSRLMIQRNPERTRQHHQVYLQRQQLLQKPADDALIRKVVQVVYYISRNGQLEHPHFMELALLSGPNYHHHLRLKDFVERLSALRGRAMPALYSWSCKRSYKSGFVWNDLAENDVISPTERDGVEYVLKGSELLVQGCTEKLEALQLIKSKDSKFQHPQITTKRRIMSSPQKIDDKNRTSLQLVVTGTLPATRDYQQVEDEEEAAAAAADPADPDEDDENSTSCYSFSTNTPPSRCSVNISSTTDDIPLLLIPTRKIERDDSSSPPSSSDKLAATMTTEPPPPVQKSSSRSNSSVLLRLIACGSSTMGLTSKWGGQRPKQLTYNKQEAYSVSGGKTCFRKQQLVCRNALTMKVAATEEDGDMEMIGCMSENPRFGGFQTGEKEYFSGSIVVDAAENWVAAGERVRLKRSNSFNEQQQTRSRKLSGVGEQREDEEEEEKVDRQRVAAGKCMPSSRKKKLAAAAANPKPSPVSK